MHAGNGASGAPTSDAVFNMLDRNHDGSISKSEWNQAFRNDASAAALLRGAGGCDSRARTPPPPTATTVATPNAAAVDDELGADRGVPLRPGQKKPFPAHWGVPPLMQTRDYVTWPEGYGAGSSSVAEWITDNLCRDAGRGSPAGPVQPLSTASGRSSPRSTTALEPPRGGWIWQQRRLQGQCATPRESIGGLGTPVSMPARGTSGSGSTGQLVRASWASGGAGRDQSPRTREASLEPHRRPRGSSAAACSGRRSEQQLSVYDRERRSHHRGLAARMGAATAGRVAEIERLLLQELEEQLVLKAGFIASCLHGWRREVHLQRAHLTFAEELQRNQASFQRSLAGVEGSYQNEALMAKRRHRQAILRAVQLSLDQALEGESAGLRRTVFTSWLSVVIAERERFNGMRRSQTFGAVMTRFAEAEKNGLSEVCFGAWVKLVDEAQNTNSHKNVVKRATAQFAESINGGLLRICYMAWQHRARAVAIVLAQFACNSRRGLLASSMRGWMDELQISKHRAKAQEALSRVGLRWEGQRASVLLQASFRGWWQSSVDGKREAREKKRLDELLTGQAAAQRELEEMRKHAKEAARAAVHNSVMTTVAKWELGNKKGLLLSVFSLWSNYAIAEAAKEAREASVHMSVEKWILSDKRGAIYGVFQSWRSEAVSTRRCRAAEQAAGKKAEDIQRLLDDTNKRFGEEAARQLTEREKKERELNRALGFTFSRMLKGDAQGMMIEVWRAWAGATHLQRRKSQQRQAVHAVIARTFGGKEQGLVRGCLHNWRGIMLDSRARRQAFEAKEMAVNKCLLGDKLGLLKTTFDEWRRYLQALARHEATRLALEKALMGDQRGLVVETLLRWQGFVSSVRIERHLSDKEQEKEDAKKRHQTELEKTQEQIAKVSMAMAISGGDSPAFLGVILASWRSHTHGVLTEKRNRRANEVSEELLREQELRKTQMKEVRLAALRKMGLAGDKALLQEAFLAWSMQAIKRKVELEKGLDRNKVTQRFGDYLVKQRMKSTDSALQQSTLEEWLKIARLSQRDREREDVQGQLEEANAYLMQLEQQRGGLEEQLWLAYKQIDHITETLQKELTTKEELAKELREAYDKQRRSNFPSAGFAMSDGLYALDHRPSSAGGVGTSRSLAIAGGERSHRGGSGGVAATDYGGDYRSEPVASVGSGLVSNLHVDRGVDVGARGTFDPQAVLNGLRSGSVLYGGGGADEDDRGGGLKCTWDNAAKAMRSEGLLHQTPDQGIL
eukprot:TRINITY_DN36996_c0_g1_i1.p1 TRINITY_DN36996_c0_g1~~TRINITY_DN36996_c0_g1_i1.p1  ORF type:complete len:1247 (+),score=255.99 TRINITY_DN36996_c0_g1_i1:124-3864(+)